MHFAGHPALDTAHIIRYVFTQNDNNEMLLNLQVSAQVAKRKGGCPAIDFLPASSTP